MKRPQTVWINQDEIEFGLLRRLTEAYISYEISEKSCYNEKVVDQLLTISGDDWYQFNKIVAQNRDDMLAALPN